MTEIEKMIWAAAFALHVNDNASNYACQRAELAVEEYRYSIEADFYDFLHPEDKKE